MVDLFQQKTKKNYVCATNKKRNHDIDYLILNMIRYRWSHKISASIDMQYDKSAHLQKSWIFEEKIQRTFNSSVKKLEKQNKHTRHCIEEIEISLYNVQFSPSKILHLWLFSMTLAYIQLTACLGQLGIFVFIPRR